MPAWHHTTRMLCTARMLTNTARQACWPPMSALGSGCSHYLTPPPPSTHLSKKVGTSPAVVRM